MICIRNIIGETEQDQIHSVDDVDGEWIDVEDNHDDEITFRANANPDEVVPNDQLDDTLLYVPSP